MPSASQLVDLESTTAVPSTPAEATLPKVLMDKEEVAPASKGHFNASLDMALHLLEQQKGQVQFYNNGLDDDRGRSDSATPINWSRTTDIPSSNLRKELDSYKNIHVAADDLILDADREYPDSPRTCVSRASTAVVVDAASATNVVKHKPNETDQVNVECKVRARIPYPGGHFYLHLYHTDEDDKEHLAIVFGDDIRSATLERSTGQDETDMDRKIRGASTGAMRQMVEYDIAHRKPASTEVGNKTEVVESIGPMGFDTDPSDQFAAGRISVVDAPLVRIHSECFTGETVSSVRCDCGYQLAEAMRVIQQEGRGVIVYLRQEGRGIGLLEKLKAYNLQDMGHDTVDANLLLNHPADARTYGSARSILADLGISKLRLLTNNTDKIRQLCHRSHLEVVCHVPMYPRWWSTSEDRDPAAQLSYARHLALKKGVMGEADKYLRTKAERMGHMLTMSPSNPSLPSIINC
ncbi:GTP cyclohydrolase II [Coemansia erecta]|uniref:GTP cyclohydrolase II n=1 Tax=Coemansia erecta TaxID=147472 RepID=A0A9W7XPZ1_9FUNG|nr:GTP cyclohydrolase II [Coemansia erecta]